MTIEEKTVSVLIVSSGRQGVKFIADLLSPTHFSPVRYVMTSGEARRALSGPSADIVIINSPLTDESGEELALDFAEYGRTGVLLIVKAELYDEKSEVLSDKGVFVLPKPFTKQMFTETMSLLFASRLQVNELIKENDTLRKKLDETKQVNRAKCMLIEKMNMTENEAHKYIEKIAMDSRKTRLEVANDVMQELAGM